MLNRLPQDLAGTNALGIELGMAATQLLWFGVGLVAMLAIAIGLRDDIIAATSTPGPSASSCWSRPSSWATRSTARACGSTSGRSASSRRVPEGRARHLPGGLPGGDADAAHERAAADRVPVDPAVAVLPADAGVVRRGDAHRRPAERPWDGAPLLRHVPDHAVRRHRTAVMSSSASSCSLPDSSWPTSCSLMHDRVDVWLDPFADPLGRGFQPVRALYALGRGGVFGSGRSW